MPFKIVSPEGGHQFKISPEQHVSGSHGVLYVGEKKYHITKDGLRESGSVNGGALLPWHDRRAQELLKSNATLNPMNGTDYWVADGCIVSFEGGNRSRATIISSSDPLFYKLNEDIIAQFTSV